MDEVNIDLIATRLGIALGRELAIERCGVTDGFIGIGGHNTLYVDQAATCYRLRFRGTRDRRDEANELSIATLSDLDRSLARLVDALSWWGDRLDIRALENGREYRVLRAFADCGPGDRVRFEGAQYAPHDSYYSYSFMGGRGPVYLCELSPSEMKVIHDIDLFLEPSD